MPTPAYFKGMPVSTGIYNALVYLAPRYKARWGWELLVRDGLRTMEDQWDAWNKRQAYLKGTGPFAPVAAYPDETAPHIAGFGVDLYDSAPYPTLTVIGSPENNWLHEEGKVVNLTNVGRTFGEGWHFEVPRGTQWWGQPAGSGSVPLPTPGINQEEDMSYPIKVQLPTGEHYFHLSMGNVKHHATLAQADLTMRITTGSDTYHTLKPSDFVDQLDAFGIPKGVVDTTNYTVFDALQKKQIKGGFWHSGAALPGVVEPPKA